VNMKVPTAKPLKQPDAMVLIFFDFANQGF
jgi:hypothetical protein